MLAWVMSGAANFGAMQAGALEVLLEAGLRPRMVVGTSAGALNALSIATDPTPAGARRLQDSWRSVGPREVGMPSLLGSVRRLITNQDSLLGNSALTRFVAHTMISEVTTFGQLRAMHGVEAYAMAVCMETGELAAFGDRDEDRLIDGAMSSTALPPYLPPWQVGGRRYLDGGVLAKLPLLAAIERGATQLIALDVTHAMGPLESARGLRGIAGYALSLMVDGQTGREVDLARSSGALLRVIQLPAPADVPFWDYAQADRLIELGQAIARRELQIRPVHLRPGWVLRLRRGLVGLARQKDEL